MCEHSRKLVAWIDGEVQGTEAAEIEQHLASCAECRNCVAEFRKVSGAFNEFCRHVARGEDTRGTIRLQPVLWAAAAAVLLAVILGYPRRHVTPTVEQPRREAMAATNSSSPATTQAAEVVPAPFPPDHHRAHRPLAVSGNKGAGPLKPCVSRNCASANAGSVPARWTPEEPTVQIAIPASAMFPPGAVPEGISFVADLSIAADGSARQVRLQREIPESERR